MSQDTYQLSFSVQASQPAPLAPEMTHGPIWNIPLWESNIGLSSNYKYYLKFKPSISGNVVYFKWYNSSGSHAVWNACNNNGSCINDGGQPQYKDTPAPGWESVFPNGWWPYAVTCSTNNSGCYSGGTGGIAQFTLVGENGVTGVAQAVHPNLIYGFAAAYPVISFDKPVPLVAGKYYQIKIEDVDPDYTHNWFSCDHYTPYQVASATKINAKGLTVLSNGVTDAVITTLSGTVNTNWQPIFGLGLDNGGYIGQGFAP